MGFLKSFKKKPKEEKDIEIKRRKGVYAVGEYIPMSPHKARRVIDQIRGRSYEEALMILELMPYRACYPIFKLIYSAAANASHNNGSNKAELWIKKVEVQKGNTIKKLKPRARGRSYLIKRPTCHILIVLQDTYYLKRIIQNIQNYPKAFSKKDKRNIFRASTKLYWAKEMVHKKYYAFLFQMRFQSPEYPEEQKDVDVYWEDIPMKYTPTLKLKKEYRRKNFDGEFDFDKDFVFYHPIRGSNRPLRIPPRNSLKYM